MRRSAQNFLSTLISDALRRLIGFFAVAYLARTLGTSGFGMINVGITVLTYAVIFSSFGLHSLATREIAANDPLKMTEHIAGLRLALAVPIFIIIAACTYFFVHTEVLAKVILLYAFSVLPNALFVDWYFQGREEMWKISVGRLVSGMVYLTVILLFVHSVATILWAGVAVVCGDTATMMVLAEFMSRSDRKFRISLQPSLWPAILKKAIPLGGGSILGALSINIAPLVLAALMTEHDVGIYSAAAKLVFFLLLLDRGFGALLLPGSARINRVAPDELGGYLTRALRWILMMALPLAVGGTMLAPRIIEFVYGPQFSASALALRIFIWYFFFTMIHTVYTNALIGTGNERLYGRIMAVSAVVYAVLIVGGVVLFGVPGAAFGCAAGEAVTLYLSWSALRKFATIPVPQSVLLMLLATVVMAGVFVVLSSFNLFLVMIAGVLAYGLVLLATKAVRIEELLSFLKPV
ncbi:MAG TPA: flippase [Bacteroidota bacterium]|nr:flippase [Bacteroidota bacterium]